MLYDERNWDYVGLSVKDFIQKFTDGLTKLVGHPPELVADWYGHLVFELEKNAPYTEQITALIAQCCDGAWYWDDNSPWEKERLKFPVAPVKEHDPYA